MSNTNEKPKVLLIDASNLYMRCLHSLVASVGFFDPNFDMYYKERVFTSLRETCNRFEPDKVIICKEGHSNWRKDVYPEYKANRAVIRENETKIDYDAFFKMHNVYEESLKKLLCNIQFLQVDHCEADDLIAIVTRTHPEWEIINQSTDKDFYQLFKYKNYKQWHPMKKEFIEVLDPENALLEKIILGDKADFVPRISGLKYRQGPVFIQKNILPDIDKWLKENNMEEEYERNTKLISFDAIPEEYVYAIKTAVDTWERGDFDRNAVYQFILDNKIMNLLGDEDRFANTFSRL